RKQSPKSGLVDELISAQGDGYLVDGRPLSDWDLVGYLATLLSAGVETTAASLANAILFFTEFECWEEIHSESRLIPSAIEESLRWYPAFPGIRRYIPSSVEI